MSVDWRHFPSLTSLRAFEATAREGSFARAARSLNVTQAAVAQQVRALEAEIGLSLAVRQGRSVELTAPGQFLAQALAEGFTRIAESVDAMRDSARDRPLRVSTTTFLTDRIILPRLSEFWRAHPGAEISISPSRNAVDLVKEGYDLAIRAVIPGHGRDLTGLDAVLLRQVPLIGIVSPELARTSGGDPRAVPWLWHEGMAEKIKAMRACGLEIDALKRVRIGSANLLLEAVRQGLGATIFNERIARLEIEAGGIAEIPLPVPSVIDYFALMPKGPHHPLAGAFADWVRELL